MRSIDFNALFTAIYNLVFGASGGIVSAFDTFVFWWGFIAMILSIVLVLLAAILHIKLARLKAEDNARYAPDLASIANEEPKNPEWERVMAALASENPSDWKLAILEADTMLDDLLIKMGYYGDNTGERLKAIEPSDFLTLNEAWEAHKVRNQIAHEREFVLTQREARQVIEKYKSVFTEFALI